MQHFPVFMALTGRRVVVSGGGEVALAKLRLLLKTEAEIEVYAAAPAPDLVKMADKGRITLHRRPFGAGDAIGAALVYAATGEAGEDGLIRAIARVEGVLVNVVDDLEASDFITPAIVDRDPVCIAIGTEGAAPVLARQIKAELEARYSPELGLIARVGKALRAEAEALPTGGARRDFWSQFYQRMGPRLARQGAEALAAGLRGLIIRHQSTADRPGLAEIVGIGPGAPELLTLAARQALDAADLVIHAETTPPAILDLARREARRIVTRSPTEATAALIAAARAGEHALWLTPGTPAPQGAAAGRLAASGVEHRLIAGLPLAPEAAAAANLDAAPRNRERVP